MTIPFIEPNESQRLLCERIASFGKTLNDGMIERDAEQILDREVWRRCAEFGIPGLPIPEQYGGSGQDMTTTLYAMKALGEACEDNGLVFAMNAQMWAFQLPVLHFGTEAQKQRYLPALCRGELIAAHAITEQEAGSDVMALCTRAVRDDDAYVLTGRKTYITNAPVADALLIFATVAPELKAAGVTAFLVERGAAGLTLPPALSKMGHRTAQMGEVLLEECRIPLENRLGAEGAGMLIFSSAMEWERTCIFAAHLGAMQRLLNQTIAYARGRKQFGMPISKYSPIADKIVEMRIAIEAGEMLLCKAAALKDAGRNATLQAAMAKLFVSEARIRQAVDAVQIHGAYGYLTRNQVERELRDAVGGAIYSG
ncbi:MAG TPA: acyl-CoA dehydrogenase family protein, partial [Chthonomonadales bacterium]|nr:acyl-CoA dehydrogenase family protein [Chthonomonadales bacterium]